MLLHWYWYQFGGASIANIVFCVCKASEVLFMQDASAKDKLEFVGLSGFAQFLGLWTFTFIMVAA